MKTGVMVAAGLAASLAGCGRGPSPQPIEESQWSQPPQAPSQPMPEQPAAQTADPAMQQAQEQLPSQPQAQEPADSAPQGGLARPRPTRGPQPMAQQPQAPAPRMAEEAVSIPAGTALRVRLEQSISTKANRPGDRFGATLVEPVTVGGRRLIPAGTAFTGRVMEAKRSGRLKGRAVLAVELDSFQLNGVRYSVATAADFRESGRHRKRNWIFIGGGTGLGTALGAMAGGPAGALIGAGAGAAAGTTGAYLTGRKNVSLPAETRLTFRLRREVPVNLGANAG